MVYLLFIAGALIEILGITISVIGVGQLVGMNLIIILMAISFDIGKIATVSSLQRNWSSLNVVMRAYGMIAILVTMMITSFGAASFLTTAMQNGISSVEKIESQLELLTQEQNRLMVRKKQIDDQIASIPSDASVRVRNSIVNGFQQEQTRVTERLAELDAKIPELQLQKIESGGKASGIVSLSKSLGIGANELVRYLVLLIIFVFDPFAIYLIMSGNHMINKGAQSKAMPEVTPVVPTEHGADVSEPPPPQPETKPQDQPAFAPEPSTQQPDSTPLAPIEEVVTSEFPTELPLTFSTVPSILETIPDQVGLFENDLNVPSQIIGAYRPQKTIYQTPKGIEL